MMLAVQETKRTASPDRNMKFRIPRESSWEWSMVRIETDRLFNVFDHSRKYFIVF